MRHRDSDDWLIVIIPVVVIVCALLSWLSPIHAEDKKPALTEVISLKITTLTLKMDNAQKTAQLAQVEYSKAETELRALVMSVTPAGYEFNLQDFMQGRDPFAKKIVAEKTGETK